MQFRARENPRINVAAQGGSLHSRPIGAQQLRRQQRIAQMQPPVLVNQQCAHQEAVLRDKIVTLKFGLHAGKTRGEALIPQPQVIEIPSQLDQALRRVVLGQ